jgi:hypothetical protein
MNGGTSTAASGREMGPRRVPVAIAGARPAPAVGTGSGRGAAAWPLFSGLGPLGALPTVPRLARAYTALVLGGWGLRCIAEDSQVIVSELATNAVRAATGDDGGPAYSDNGRLPVVWVRLMTDLALLGIEVWDTLPAAVGVPVRREATLDAESGRGLEIVASLSTDWGWEPVPHMHAKRTWALLAVGVSVQPEYAAESPQYPAQTHDARRDLS